MAKITTGRQLLEWLQKQPDSVLDDKLLITGEDIPAHSSLSPQVLKQDLWYDGDEFCIEWNELVSELNLRPGTKEEQEKEAEERGAYKEYDKGGIIIYI